MLGAAAYMSAIMWQDDLILPQARGDGPGNVGGGQGCTAVDIAQHWLGRLVAGASSVDRCLLLRLLVLMISSHHIMYTRCRVYRLPRVNKI